MSPSNIVSLLVVLACVGSVVHGFNWTASLIELREQRAQWDAYGISSYYFEISTSCFCMLCWVAEKRIYVEANQITNVEYVDDGNYDTSSCSISYPLDANYKSMTGLFDMAEAHLQQGLNSSSSCANSTYGFLCGGSLGAVYDATYHYLTSVSINYNPMIADAGTSYTIDCLTLTASNTTASSTNYQNSCSPSGSTTTSFAYIFLFYALYFGYFFG
jgi:hypothetical protein